MIRRNFLAAVPLAAGAGMLGSASDATASVSPELADHFAQQYDIHWQADRMLGASTLTATVAEQYAAISRLARVAAGPLRTRLVHIGGTYAVLAGWLHQDAGNWDASAAWYGIAHADAVMSGDPDLVAWVLSSMAYLRVDLGDGRAAVDLSAAGLRDRHRLSDRIVVTLLAQQANGAALLGDRHTVEQLLDEAERVADTSVEDGATWATVHRNAHFFAVRRATNYGVLGLHREASSLWEEISRQMPATARRDAGVYLARRATACAHLGEPEMAVGLAAESAAVAADTRSGRHRAELANLADAMRPWHGHALGAELRQALSVAT